MLDDDAVMLELAAEEEADVVAPTDDVDELEATAVEELDELEAPSDPVIQAAVELEETEAAPVVDPVDDAKLLVDERALWLEDDAVVPTADEP